MGPTRRTLRLGLLEDGGTGQISCTAEVLENWRCLKVGCTTKMMKAYYMRPLDFGGLPILFKNPKWRKRKNWWSLPVLARCPCVPWALTRLTLHPGMGCREISPASTKCLGRMLSLDSSPLDKAAGFGWLWIIHILFVGCHISNKSMHFEKNSYSTLLYFVFLMVRYDTGGFKHCPAVSFQKLILPPAQWAQVSGRGQHAVVAGFLWPAAVWSGRRLHIHRIR